jgi:hypothetical protein
MGRQTEGTLFAIDRLRERMKKEFFGPLFVACPGRPSSTLQQMITPINISFAEILMRLRLVDKKKSTERNRESSPRGSDEREEFMCRSAARSSKSLIYANELIILCLHHQTGDIFSQGLQGKSERLKNNSRILRIFFCLFCCIKSNRARE